MDQDVKRLGVEEVKGLWGACLRDADFGGIDKKKGVLVNIMGSWADAKEVLEAVGSGVKYAAGGGYGWW